MQEPHPKPYAWQPGEPSLGARAAAAGDGDVDDALMARVRGGDRAALGELYDRHAAAMLGLALRILRDRGNAEDLVHDVFLEAWRKASSFSRERGRLRTWLLVRTRSRAIDRLRSLEVVRRHARRVEAKGEVEVRSGPDDDPGGAPDRRRARIALAALPDAQRHVVELAYFEGLSCSEIATRCDAPLGTVKSRLLAGMRELRRLFEASEAPDGA